MGKTKRRRKERIGAGRRDRRKAFAGRTKTPKSNEAAKTERRIDRKGEKKPEVTRGPCTKDRSKRKVGILPERTL